MNNKKSRNFTSILVTDRVSRSHYVVPLFCTFIQSCHGPGVGLNLFVINNTIFEEGDSAESLYVETGSEN